MSTEKTINFVMMLLDEAPDRFLLVRNVNEYATHYLGPDGMWVAWPEDDNDLADLFETIKDSPQNFLPQFDTSAAEQINNDLEAADDEDGYEN